MVLLDERGKEYSSVQFAAYIERKTHVVPKRLVFIVGGPYGFSSRVYKAANEKISLSKMTFSHQNIPNDIPKAFKTGDVQCLEKYMEDKILLTISGIKQQLPRPNQRRRHSSWRRDGSTYF